MREQPGFRSYTLVRSGEWEIIAITLFDSEAAIDAAMAAVAPLVRARQAARDGGAGSTSRHGGASPHGLRGIRRAVQ